MGSTNEEAKIKFQGDVPEIAYDMPLDDLGLLPHLTQLLISEGYVSVGKLMNAIQQDREALLALRGIGPVAMGRIDMAIGKIEFPPERDYSLVDIESGVLQPADVGEERIGAPASIKEDVKKPKRKKKDKKKKKVKKDSKKEKKRMKKEKGKTKGKKGSGKKGKKKEKGNGKKKNKKKAMK
jgi:hypothetical protein